MTPRDDDPAVRRFDDEQVALILRRAAEMEARTGDSSRAGMSLTEIQEVAAAVGISRDHVAVVAAGLTVPQRRNWFFGAPTRFRCERTIDGRLSEQAIGELLDVARGEFGLQGEIKSAAGEIEWRARTTVGVTIVNIAPRGERTKISVLVAREDGAFLTALAGGFVGAGAAAAVGIAMHAGLHASAPMSTLAAALTVFPALSIWTRVLWRRFSRRWTEQVEQVGDAIVRRLR